MCSGPILKKMLVFAVPLMCSSMLQLLFNAADIVVVGRYAGDNSLAAVGSNSSLINLLVNLFVGLSIGSSVTVGHYYGAKQEKEVSETVHTSMLLSIISGVFLTFLGVLGAEKLLHLMQAPEEVLPLAALYLRIYFLGMVAVMVYNFGSAILRAVGDTRRPLYYLSAAGVINVLLNLFFVIRLKMDVAGVALATIISQYISAALVLRCLLKEEGAVRLILRDLHIYKDKLIRILQVGLPAGFQGMLFSLSNVVIQSSINGFGAVVVAGSSAAANIEGFVYTAMNAFHQACLSFTSQNMGAGKFKRIYPILLQAQLSVIVVGLVFGGLVVVFSPQLLGIYSSSPDVIAEGVKRLKYVAGPYALCGMMDVMVGALRGLGYSVMPMIVSLLGACGFRLVWLATVFQMEDFHTIEIIYWSYPISWVLTFAAHLVCFYVLSRHLQKKLGVAFR